MQIVPPQGTTRATGIILKSAHRTAMAPTRQGAQTQAPPRLQIFRWEERFAPITASCASNRTQKTRNAPSARPLFVLTFVLSRYYSSVQPPYESHEMLRGAPHDNEIRASERNSSKIMPKPVQIDHVQTKFRVFKISRFSVS